MMFFLHLASLHGAPSRYARLDEARLGMSGYLFGDLSGPRHIIFFSPSSPVRLRNGSFLPFSFFPFFISPVFAFVASVCCLCLIFSSLVFFLFSCIFFYPFSLFSLFFFYLYLTCSFSEVSVLSMFLHDL